MKTIGSLLLVLLTCGPFGAATAGEAVLWRNMAGMLMVGYARGGAGFAFSPNVDIVVTSLGSGDEQVTSEPVEVVLWNTNGQRMVSAIVTTNSSVYNATYYERVRPAFLAANETYYVSSCGTNSGMWLGRVIEADYGRGSFEVALELTFIGMGAATNLDGTFPYDLAPGAILPSGANFQFVMPPVITLGGLRLAPSQVHLDIEVAARERPSFTLLQAQHPSGPWMTNLDFIVLTNAPAGSYTLRAAPQGNACFYRVQSP